MNDYNKLEFDQYKTGREKLIYKIFIPTTMFTAIPMICGQFNKCVCDKK
jgi:hypothetical protein